ncbi:MAG: ABC transporter substrate-binding protein [Acidocella sp. 21-58-7]|nr:MAG: ABC transporter substrate-binding protein [Acidocella sp. 21-58-7]
MAKDLHPIKILAFPGAPNLPVFAAREKGFFSEAGLDLQFATTPSSIYQFEQFASGGCDIAFTAFDNIVAYREGQGAAKLAEVPEFRVLLGATQIELSVIVSTDIKTAADLKGKSVALDAVSTGFAFVFYALLEKLGLSQSDYQAVAVGATPDRWLSVKDGKHAATITIEPFTSIAKAAGFHVLTTSSDVFPAYQGGIIAARSDWAAANSGVVKSFLSAYLRWLDWVLNPANQKEGAELLLANMPDIKRGVVGAVMDSLLSPRSGLTPGGEVLPQGVAEVLKLRSNYGRPQKSLTDAAKYFDLSYRDAIKN